MHRHKAIPPMHREPSSIPMGHSSNIPESTDSSAPEHRAADTQAAVEELPVRLEYCCQYTDRNHPDLRRPARSARCYTRYRPVHYRQVAQCCQVQRCCSCLLRSARHCPAVDTSRHFELAGPSFRWMLPASVASPLPARAVHSARPLQPHSGESRYRADRSYSPQPDRRHLHSQSAQECCHSSVGIRPVSKLRWLPTQSQDIVVSIWSYS